MFVGAFALEREIVMKRVLGLLVALMMTACAPTMNADRSTTPVVSTPRSSENAKLSVEKSPFAFLFEEQAPEPAIVVECVKGEKCVPTHRIATEIDEASTAKAIKWIEAANKAGASALLLEMNTPGGSVPDGFELAKAIENSAAPVSCVIDGEGASMGFYLLQSCEKRYMTKRSKLMAHEPALSGQMRGTPNQWQAITDMLKAERDALAEHCAARLKVSLKYYHSRTDGGQMWWMTHVEATKVAAVDEVVKSVKDLLQQMKK